MGKVTLYYLLHAGRGAFDSPRFRRAFRDADVIDLESETGVSAETKKAIRAVARGDHKAYEQLTDAFKLTHELLHNPIELHKLELLELLFNSKKKVEFEERLPRGSRSRYKARMYRMFPAMNVYARPADRKKFADESAKAGRDVPPHDILMLVGAAGGMDDALLDRYYGFMFGEQAPAIIRSFADSERIARKTRIEPRQNRLVLRGASHSVTTQFLKNMGVNAKSVTPVAPDKIQRKMLEGRHVTLEEAGEHSRAYAGFVLRLEKGMRTYEAAGRAGLLKKRRK